jgi:hypothetical protein
MIFCILRRHKLSDSMIPQFYPYQLSAHRTTSAAILPLLPVHCTVNSPACVDVMVLLYQLDLEYLTGGLCTVRTAPFREVV